MSALANQLNSCLNRFVQFRHKNNTHTEHVQGFTESYGTKEFVFAGKMCYLNILFTSDTKLCFFEIDKFNSIDSNSNLVANVEL